MKNIKEEMVTGPEISGTTDGAKAPILGGGVPDPKKKNKKKLREVLPKPILKREFPN